MSAQGNKFRNRPEEDLTTRRTAEDELMRGDRGVGQSGDGSEGGSGTGGRGLENEGTGSLLVNDPGGAPREGDETRSDAADEQKEGEGHSGPIRSGAGKKNSATEQDRAADGEDDDNAREGYEDHGSSRDAGGTQGESSGSKPGYR